MDMPYDSGNQNNDIVILKLSEKLVLSHSNGAYPACLPDSSFAPDTTGQTCFVSGWGTLEYGGSYPQTLQWVDVAMMTNEKCNQAYGSITDSMICAGYDEGGKDACQGDSGGPLVCHSNPNDRKSGNAIITGVVSFGQGCAWQGWAGVYARVTAFLDWIADNMVTIHMKNVHKDTNIF